ncbi:hypothetical protein AOLI_G00302950 [Acnodon oligacanthus]
MGAALWVLLQFGRAAHLTTYLQCLLSWQQQRAGRPEALRGVERGEVGQSWHWPGCRVSGPVLPQAFIFSSLGILFSRPSVFAVANSGGQATSLPTLGASDFNYLKIKTSRPSLEERVCERGISGAARSHGSDILPGEAGPCPSWFLTAAYLCRARGSFHSPGHCVEQGWARNGLFLLDSLSPHPPSQPWPY